MSEIELEEILTRLFITNALSQTTVTTDMVMTALKEVPLFLQGFTEIRYNPTMKCIIVSNVQGLDVKP